jgi:hypothetical protein
MMMLGGGLSLHGAMEQVQSDHFEVQRCRRGKSRINRHEVVLACHLQSMACVEQRPGLGVGQGLGKVADDAIQAGFVEVTAFDHLKAELLQDHGDVVASSFGLLSLLVFLYSALPPYTRCAASPGLLPALSLLGQCQAQAQQAGRNASMPPKKDPRTEQTAWPSRYRLAVNCVKKKPSAS